MFEECDYLFSIRNILEIVTEQLNLQMVCNKMDSKEKDQMFWKVQSSQAQTCAMNGQNLMSQNAL